MTTHASRSYCDTNILVYSISNDPRREVATELLVLSHVIGVQCLNELTNVLLRKMKKDWPFVKTSLHHFEEMFEEILPITLETHQLAAELAHAHSLSFYDGLHVAAAKLGNCDIFYSEDLQHGRKFGELTIINPFLGIAPIKP